MTPPPPRRPRLAGGRGSARAGTETARAARPRPAAPPPPPPLDAPAPAPKAEAGWDQMFPAEEPASPAAEGPKAPAPEADPCAEFAADAARKRDEKLPPPEGGEGS